MDRLPPECAAVRALRRRHGVSVERLAEASGFSVDVIYHFERGTRVPKRQELERLAAALRHPVATVAPLVRALKGEEGGAPRPGPRSPLDLSPEEEEALDRETALLGCDVAARAREWAAQEIRGQHRALARNGLSRRELSWLNAPGARSGTHGRCEGVLGCPCISQSARGDPA